MFERIVAARRLAAVPKQTLGALFFRRSRKAPTPRPLAATVPYCTADRLRAPYPRGRLESNRHRCLERRVHAISASSARAGRPGRGPDRNRVCARHLFPGFHGAYADPRRMGGALVRPSQRIQERPRSRTRRRPRSYRISSDVPLVVRRLRMRLPAPCRYALPLARRPAVRLRPKPSFLAIAERRSA